MRGGAPENARRRRYRLGPRQAKAAGTATTAAREAARSRGEEEVGDDDGGGKEEEERDLHRDARYGEIWGDMGRHGEMWGDVGRCGEMWGDVGRYGERSEPGRVSQQARAREEDGQHRAADGADGDEGYRPRGRERSCGTVGRYGEIWGDMGRYGEMGTELWHGAQRTHAAAQPRDRNLLGIFHNPGTGIAWQHKSI